MAEVDNILDEIIKGYAAEEEPSKKPGLTYPDLQYQYEIEKRKMRREMRDRDFAIMLAKFKALYARNKDKEATKFLEEGIRLELKKMKASADLDKELAHISGQYGLAQQKMQSSTQLAIERMNYQLGLANIGYKAGGLSKEDIKQSQTDFGKIHAGVIQKNIEGFLKFYGKKDDKKAWLSDLIEKIRRMDIEKTKDPYKMTFYNTLRIQLENLFSAVDKNRFISKEIAFSTLKMKRKFKLHFTGFGNKDLIIDNIILDPKKNIPVNPLIDIMRIDLGFTPEIKEGIKKLGIDISSDLPENYGIFFKDYIMELEKKGSRRSGTLGKIWEVMTTRR